LTWAPSVKVVSITAQLWTTNQVSAGKNGR